MLNKFSTTTTPPKSKSKPQQKSNTLSFDTSDGQAPFLLPTSPPSSILGIEEPKSSHATCPLVWWSYCTDHSWVTIFEERAGLQFQIKPHSDKLVVHWQLSAPDYLFPVLNLPDNTTKIQSISGQETIIPPPSVVPLETNPDLIQRRVTMGWRVIVFKASIAGQSILLWHFFTVTLFYFLTMPFVCHVYKDCNSI